MSSSLKCFSTRRRRVAVSGYVFIALLHAMAAAHCNAQSASMIHSLVDEVSAANIEAHIDALSNGIGPRSTDETRAAAADYIANQLEGFGYAVTRQRVIGAEQVGENVVAQLPGMVNPDKTFVIGAHFDTVAGSPGADDNASGVAAVLEIARAVRDTRSDFSMEFVGFGLEEAGIIGSREYARDAAAQGRELIGTVSLDMIGYRSTREDSQIPIPNIPDCLAVSESGRTVGDFIAAVGNDNSAKLIERFQQAATQYVPELLVITGQVAGNGECFPDSRRSDHYRFWDEGYQALLLVDTAEFRNPHYHQPSDTLATLDLGFARQVTQATLATALVSTNMLPGDFDGDTLLSVQDIDVLTAEIRKDEPRFWFDTDGNEIVDGDDRTWWVHELKNTYFGDSNLDGEFNTGDLVAVFQAGEYEDGVNQNSTWATGDWDGDTEFNTSDLVDAFQDGGFEAGPRQAIANVPEPATLACWAIVGLLLVGRQARRGSKKGLMTGGRMGRKRCGDSYSHNSAIVAASFLIMANGENSVRATNLLLNGNGKPWTSGLSTLRVTLPLALLLLGLGSQEASAFRVIDVTQLNDFSHLGIARWNAAPHSVNGVERSLDGGLRFSVEGGSYEAFRDKFQWQEPAPTVEQFQAAVEGAFAVWEVQDPETGLGTDLHFVPDFETPIVIEDVPRTLQGFFKLNRGAEIDLASASFGDSTLATAFTFGDPDSESVTLTSGVSDYSAAVFSGADIRLRRTSLTLGNVPTPWDLTDFTKVLTHEIGHVLSLQHPEAKTGSGGFVSAFYDDNFDGTSHEAARETLTNSFADLIDPMDPDNSQALKQIEICTSGDDPCTSSPGSDTSGVEMVMEATVQEMSQEMRNDDFAARQFLYPFIKVTGDFNADKELTVEDIDLLSAELRNGERRYWFDTDGNGITTANDRTNWVHELKNTYYGDANLDGEFNSADLVALFTAGQYEDGISMNSTWATGDFVGDGDFGTEDLVSAFADGGYEQGPRATVASVPEPSSLVTLLFSLAIFARQRRS